MLQGLNPKYVVNDKGYYDRHMHSFAIKMDETIATVFDELKNIDPLFFGFSMKMDSWLFSSIIAKKIKGTYPNTPILIGGINTKDSAVSFLEAFPHFDYAIWGEGEVPLLEFTKCIEKKQQVLLNVSNIAAKREEKILVSERPNKEYWNLSTKGVYPNYYDYFQQKKELHVIAEPGIPIEGSRGCHWDKCHFCFLNTDYRYRLKSIEKIVDEIKFMINEYKIYKFEFLDNDLVGNNLMRFDNLLDELIKIKSEIPKFQIILAEIITKGLNHAIIKKMFQAGITFAQIGYESSSESLLKKINKKNTFASNLLYIKYAKFYNIPLKTVNTITNLIEETPDDIIEASNNLRFLRFFLAPKYFQHALVPLCINKNSKYYKNIQPEIQQWEPLTLAQSLTAKSMSPNNQWNIFHFIKHTRSIQWEMLSKIEHHYLTNNYSYKIEKKKDLFSYIEFLNWETIASLQIERNSLDHKILLFTNDGVISLKKLQPKICQSLENHSYTEKEIIKSIHSLYDKGLIYHSKDYEEIVSIIHLDGDN